MSAARDCGKHSTPEARIKVRDLQNSFYQLTDIHEFEADSFRFSLLAQLQHDSQTVGINRMYSRNEESIA